MAEEFPNSKTSLIGNKRKIIILGEAPANNCWRKSEVVGYDIKGKLLPFGVVFKNF